MDKSNESVLNAPMPSTYTAVAASIGQDRPTDRNKTPSVMVWSVVGICVLPFLLTLLGFDFSSHPVPFDPAAASSMAKGELIDAMFHQLPGAFTHTLLEWSAFCAAIFTVILAFSHYRITGDATTPIIGVALFCAGCMDAFHTLAAARLIEAVADNHDLIPFTWAICRMFNALIMIFGVGLLLVTGANKWKTDMRMIVLVSLVFAFVGYLLIHYCATSQQLPQTMFPNEVITRPWDVGPLLLFLFAGLVIYPKFYKLRPSLFTHALIISAIPEVAVEMYMAFGSTALFDNYFNIAHFLKVVAYLVPFAGLVLGYIRTYQEEQQLVLQLEVAHQEQAEHNRIVENFNADLRRSNTELEQFAYVASHDLQEPLRMVASYTQLLAKRYQGKLDADADEFIGYAVDGAKRMQGLVHDLLDYSRVGTQGKPLAPIDAEAVYRHALANLQITLEENQAVVTHDELPTIMGDDIQLTQLFQNLIGNAVKYRRESPEIHVSAKNENNEWLFSVRDNGIGIDPQFKERIFCDLPATASERRLCRYGYWSGCLQKDCGKARRPHLGRFRAWQRQYVLFQYPCNDITL